MYYWKLRGVEWFNRASFLNIFPQPVMPPRRLFRIAKKDGITPIAAKLTTANLFKKYQGVKLHAVSFN